MLVGNNKLEAPFINCLSLTPSIDIHNRNVLLQGTSMEFLVILAIKGVVVVLFITIARIASIHASFEDNQFLDFWSTKGSNAILWDAAEVLSLQQKH
jgi:hypothetical protein